MNSMKRIIQITDKIMHPENFIAFLKVGGTFRCVNATNLYGRFSVLVIKGANGFIAGHELF